MHVARLTDNDDVDNGRPEHDIAVRLDACHSRQFAKLLQPAGSFELGGIELHTVDSVR